jgi:hypothetical protein
VDVVLTSLDPTIAMSTAMAVQLEGRAVASRLMAGTCPLANLSSAKSPLQTFVVQNASSGPAVLSVWAACTGVQGDEDGFLAIYKRSVAVPTAIPMTDAERLACTGRVSEGSSGTTRLGSLETGGSAWCPGLTKANGAGVALQRCERAVVQVQAYDVASTDYPPPKTLKFRLESP